MDQLPEVLKEHLEGNRKANDEISETLFEVAFVRGVENYLCYIAEILKDTLRANHNIMKSEEMVTLEQVLSWPDMPSFITWWADEKINKLSFGGFDDMSKFAQKRLKISLVPDMSDDVKYGVAARNILVHHRGIADEQFLRTSGSKRWAVGQRIRVPHDFARRVGPALCSSVNHIDESLSSKYGLPRQEWPS